ncbi:MAG TPA: aminomethyl-transferring glycine dehydrogenase subunit GcvPA [Syntrophomonadaceae bacterium]|nr:aminomethyl-transferring glycine dehydrogenase subunit GcvPA [Syntrophomonadaceae bacterium]HQA07226.1 aminomethyl-transferring glycine dehydrogenase subunit GcvPA [Syntrophomonadaceae bacterium]HQE22415.1 aminomethyl-transferring glycine dehydrogenase subunit GcvPA [Syntrophomonadaceae bacterium]
MADKKCFVHPYIPNSAPAVEQAMLEELGETAAENLYRVIPDNLKLHRKLDLPEPLVSEYELKRHVEKILAKNQTCDEYISFLGSGYWHHYVPAVCSEIANRAEFLTAYWGDTYSDFGKWQAMFEYQSLMGELLNMEVVSSPTYDWSSAASSAIMMAVRITGRSDVLVPSNISKGRLSQMKNFIHGRANLKTVEYTANGTLSLEDLHKKISADTAAVYFENPTFFGCFETQGKEIADLAHKAGALVVVGVDPSSLGIVNPPADYGADIVCGDAQPLGNAMNYGGGACGFIATQDDERLVAEYPTLLVSIAKGENEDLWAFGECTHERTSYVKRGDSPDFIGTSQWLNAITSGVYLSLMGPAGMKELGEGILRRTAYTIKQLSSLEGVRTPVFNGPHFKEFIVNFDATGKTVAEINKKLLSYGIFGGKDLSRDYPEFGQSAQYCVTEVHSLDDINRLVSALKEVLA